MLYNSYEYDNSGTNFWFENFWENFFEKKIFF